MKLQVKIGNRVIKDSSKHQVSKIIEPPVEKEKIIHDKVQSRSDKIIDNQKVLSVSSQASILDPIKATEILNEVNNFSKEEEKDINKKLSESLESDNYDDAELDDMYDEYEEYDQYLSNRQRSNKVNLKMKSSKKSNNDFKGF